MKNIVWELPSGKHIVEIFCLILGRRSQTSKEQWGWDPDQSTIVGANINPKRHHHPYPQPHHRHRPQHHYHHHRHCFQMREMKNRQQF